MALASTPPPSSLYFCTQPQLSSPPSLKTPRTATARQQYQNATLTVEDLTDSDLGYASDVEILRPDELEEFESPSPTETYVPETHQTPRVTPAPDDTNDTTIVRRMRRLRCQERLTHASNLAHHPHVPLSPPTSTQTSSARKRRHSETLPAAAATPIDTDPATSPEYYQRDDHDLESSVRRLRRRIRGPVAGDNYAFLSDDNHNNNTTTATTTTSTSSTTPVTRVSSSAEPSDLEYARLVNRSGDSAPPPQSTLPQPFASPAAMPSGDDPMDIDPTAPTAVAPLATPSSPA